MEWTKEEEQLRDLAKTGKLVWLTPDDTFRRVRSVRAVDDEPSPCAMLDDGTYCALYCCDPDLSEFYLVEPINLD